MRGSQLLASPLQQDICIFSSCRLQARARPSRPRVTRSRRFSAISSTRQDRQDSTPVDTQKAWLRHSPVRRLQIPGLKEKPHFRYMKKDKPVLDDQRSTHDESSLKATEGVRKRPEQRHRVENKQPQAIRKRGELALSFGRKEEPAQTSAKKVEPPPEKPEPAKRVAAPSFLASAEEDTSDVAQESGWGRGSTQRSDVQYGERPEDISTEQKADIQRFTPDSVGQPSSNTPVTSYKPPASNSPSTSNTSSSSNTPSTSDSPPQSMTSLGNGGDHTKIQASSDIEAVDNGQQGGTVDSWLQDQTRDVRPREIRSTYSNVGHTSTVTPPQPMNPFGDSGYRSKILTSGDVEALVDSQQHEKVDSWLHFQPKSTTEAPKSPEVNVTETTPPPTAASIEQQFEEYRRKREAESQTQSRSEETSQIPIELPTRTQHRSVDEFGRPDRPEYAVGRTDVRSNYTAFRPTFLSPAEDTKRDQSVPEEPKWKGFSVAHSLFAARAVENEFGISEKGDTFPEQKPIEKPKSTTTTESDSSALDRLLAVTKSPQKTAATTKQNQQSSSLDWVDAAFAKSSEPPPIKDTGPQLYSPSIPATARPTSRSDGLVRRTKSDSPIQDSSFRQESYNDDARSDFEPRGRVSEVDHSRGVIERALKSDRFGDRPTRERKKGRGRDDEDDARYEDDEDFRAKARVRAARKAEKDERKQAEKEERARALAEQRAIDGKPISLPDYITAAQLAQALHVHYDKFVRNLESLGYEDVFANKVYNAETSAMIAIEYGYNPNLAEEGADQDRDLKAQPEMEDKSLLPSRPPVVTIMGHVDHGKTTILDYLRNANVVAGEAGGITQHIGAFSVYLENSDKSITFLDTPGHAAFLAMRQRGANVTDIVVLVVAADDSVKPQTLEALKHARAANVPIIVAVNKIDKPEADLVKVKQDLARHSIDIEDFGGDTQVIPVSGKTGQGMKELEEAIVTQSEILDHRAQDDGVVEGWVIEATTKERGRVATVLVRRGTLKVGTILVAGKTWARVRSLQDDAGREVDEASPGIPVEVDGWRDQPSAGDEVLQATSEQKAADVIKYREDQAERKRLATDTEAINEARIQEQIKREEAARAEAGEDVTPESRSESGGQIVVPFVIKADVSGSAEAIEAYVMGVSSPLITPRILNASVGQVNESDIELAAAAQGHVIAFNLQTSESMKGLASMHKIKLLEHNIIYRVTEEVKEILEDMLPPVITQKVTGEAVIAQDFEISLGGRKKMKIAGCRVSNGVITRSSRVRVYRGGMDGEKVFDGSLSSLKHVKRDVQEMRKGSECGMSFESWQDFLPGDVVQCYSEISQKRTLNG